MLVWNKCRAQTKAETSGSPPGETIDNQALCAKKAELLNVFFKRYDWRLPVELTPSDHTFTLIARARRKRSAEFIPLSRVASLVDVKGTNEAHVRIKGTNGDLFFDPTRSLTRKIWILINHTNRLISQSEYSCIVTF